MISYQRLWETMREKGITQYVLINTYHISPGQITRLKRNESVSIQLKKSWNTSQMRKIPKSKRSYL